MDMECNAQRSGIGLVSRMQTSMQRAHQHRDGLQVDLSPILVDAAQPLEVLGPHSQHLGKLFLCEIHLPCDLGPAAVGVVLTT